MFLLLRYKIFRLLAYSHLLISTLCLSVNINNRNPFMYVNDLESQNLETSKSLRCIAIGKLNHNYFALIEYDLQRYKVMLGDKLDNYKVININEHGLDLIDEMGNIKALQLI